MKKMDALYQIRWVLGSEEDFCSMVSRVSDLVNRNDLFPIGSVSTEICARWSDWEEDLKNVSKEYPNLIFRGVAAYIDAPSKTIEFRNGKSREIVA